MGGQASRTLVSTACERMCAHACTCNGFVHHRFKSPTLRTAFAKRYSDINAWLSQNDTLLSTHHPLKRGLCYQRTPPSKPSLKTRLCYQRVTLSKRNSAINASLSQNGTLLSTHPSLKRRLFYQRVTLSKRDSANNASLSRNETLLSLSGIHLDPYSSVVFRFPSDSWFGFSEACKAPVKAQRDSPKFFDTGIHACPACRARALEGGSWPLAAKAKAQAAAKRRPRRRPTGPTSRWPVAAR